MCAGRPLCSAVGGCGMVCYCSKDHQKHDWKEHKFACKEFQAMRSKGQTWESDVKQNEYSGTFRWSQKKDFMQLPPSRATASLGAGWQEYFATRFEDTAEGKVVLDVATVDGLSFPMSFLYAMRCLLQSNCGLKDWLYGGLRKVTMVRRQEKLTIVAVGTAERAEEHVLHHTNYWQEISNMMPSFDLDLWLVGPEMSKAGHQTKRSQGPRMVAGCFRGTLSEFLAENKFLTDEGPAGKVVTVGFNTGMASGDAALKRSWERDIRHLLHQNILSIFTCANDHTDLKCEHALMAGLGAQYVLPARKNEFAAVTVLHPPGQQESGWYSANAFIYAVQGLAIGNINTHASGSKPRDVMLNPASSAHITSTPAGKVHCSSDPASSATASSAPTTPASVTSATGNSALATSAPASSESASSGPATSAPANQLPTSSVHATSVPESTSHAPQAPDAAAAAAASKACASNAEGSAGSALPAAASLKVASTALIHAGSASPVLDSNLPASSAPPSSTPASTDPTHAGSAGLGLDSNLPASSASCSSTPASTDPIHAGSAGPVPDSNLLASSAPPSSTPASTDPIHAGSAGLGLDSNLPASSAPPSSTPASTDHIHAGSAGPVLDSNLPASSAPPSSTPASTDHIHAGSAGPVLDSNLPASSAPPSSTPASTDHIHAGSAGLGLESNLPASSAPCSSTPASTDPIHAGSAGLGLDSNLPASSAPCSSTPARTCPIHAGSAGPVPDKNLPGSSAPATAWPAAPMLGSFKPGSSTARSKMSGGSSNISLASSAPASSAPVSAAHGYPSDRSPSGSKDVDDVMDHSWAMQHGGSSDVLTCMASGKLTDCSAHSTEKCGAGGGELDNSNDLYLPD